MKKPVILNSCYFNPRSPCGERHQLHISSSVSDEFQSTLSLRRATDFFSSMVFTLQNFNPRSPCGERHIENGENFFKIISIHALLAESD